MYVDCKLSLLRQLELEKLAPAAPQVEGEKDKDKGEVVTTVFPSANTTKTYPHPADLLKIIAEKDKQITELKWQLNDAKVLNEQFQSSIASLEKQIPEVAAEAWETARKYYMWAPDKATYMSKFNQSQDK
jgi:hypothetical protein